MPATVVRTYTFNSRGDEERLVRRPKVVEETTLGRQITRQEALRYEFAPQGTLTVEEGQDVLLDGPLDPVTREPTAQDALSWLRGHDLFNVRFWEEGNEPDRPRPLEDDFLEEVTAAVAGLQVAPIQVLLDAERATHNRPLLVRAAERSIAQIEATLASIPDADAEPAVGDAKPDGKGSPPKA